VEMDVVAVAPPYSYYQGVEDIALYQTGATVAPGGLVEIVMELELEVCPCKHNPLRDSSNSRYDRFIDNTVTYIGTGTGRL